MSATSKGSRRLRSNRQLADQLRKDLAQGRWGVGETLPAIRQLADEYRSSFNATRQVLLELGDEGLVELVPRSGVVVRQTGVAPQRNPKKTLVGVVGHLHPVSEVGAGWGSLIYQAACEELGRAGYDTLLIGDHFNDNCESFIARLKSVQGSLAGVIASSVNPKICKVLEELDRMGVPWVTANRSSETVQHNFVTADNIRDSRRVGQLFARLNLDRTLVLYNDLILSGSSVEKVNGFVAGYILEGKSLGGIELLDCGDTTEDVGYEHTQAFLKANPNYQPQGVFAIGDCLAIGAIRALQEAGLSVPNDVGVVGATGLDWSSTTTPPLSVLVQPVSEIGREMVRLLLEMTREDVGRMTGRRITCPFILRESLQAPQSMLEELGLY